MSRYVKASAVTTALIGLVAASAWFVPGLSNEVQHAIAAAALVVALFVILTLIVAEFL